MNYQKTENEIGGEGAKVLCEALGVNQTLKELNLWSVEGRRIG